MPPPPPRNCDLKKNVDVNHYSGTFVGSSFNPWELVWRSGCVMDCYATARGSIPGGYDVKTELRVLRKRQ